jgi:hypothetical protein
MAFVYMFLASLFTSFSNLFLRKSVDLRGENAGDPFLIQRLLASALVVFIAILIQQKSVSLEWTTSLLGIAAGLFLGALMWSMAQTLKRGPSGLTFAILNAASMAPPLILALVFGEAYGHGYTLWNGIGSLLVVAGLLWMGWSKESTSWQKSWIPWIIGAFLIHASFLIFFQWRALLLKDGLPPSVLLPFKCDASCGDSFTLLMFLIAAGMQLFMPRRTTRDYTFSEQAFWGGLGGFLNGIGILFMVTAADAAFYSIEKTFLFPLYCVALIVLNNIWSTLMYGEKINWAATMVCVSGIIVGLGEIPKSLA